MQVVSFRNDDGVRNGLVIDTGRKWKKLLFMNGSGLTVERIEIGSDADKALKPLEKPTLSHAKSTFREAANKFGCTKEVALAIGLKRAITKPRDPKPEGEPAPKSGAAKKAAAQGSGKAPRTRSRNAEGKGPTVLAREACEQFITSNKLLDRARERDVVKQIKDAMREASPDAAQATINTQFHQTRKRLEEEAQA